MEKLYRYLLKYKISKRNIMRVSLGNFKATTDEFSTLTSNNLSLRIKIGHFLCLLQIKYFRNTEFQSTVSRPIRSKILRIISIFYCEFRRSCK